VNATQIFRTFVVTYEEERRRESSPLWLYYRKDEAIADHIRASDWTPAITTFLDVLAARLDLFHLYERRLAPGSWARMDGVWVSQSEPGMPLVAIEADNMPLSVFDSEVKKLVVHRAPTKVLVTEHEAGYRGRSSRQWRQDYRAAVRDAIVRHDPGQIPPRRLDFILILADQVMINSRDWWGFSLAKRNGKWASRWRRLRAE